MLIAAWQLKITACIILLASCLGQELFCRREKDYCFERYLKRQAVERGQARQLSQDRNKSGEDDNRSEVISDTTRLEGRHNFWDRFDCNEKYLYRQDIEERLYRRANKNSREEKENFLGYFDESTNEQTSERYLENRGKERYASPKLEEGSCIDSSSNTVRELASINEPRYDSNRRISQSVSRRSRAQDIRKRLDIKRDGRNENLQRGYRYEEGENMRHHVSLNAERDIVGNIYRQASFIQRDSKRNDRYERLQHDLIIQNIREFGQRERDVNKNHRKLTKSYDGEIPQDVKINAAYRAAVHPENRRRTESVESVIFRSLSDDRNSRQDRSHRQKSLLSVQSSGNIENMRAKRSESILSNRRDAQFYIAEQSMSNRQHAQKPFTRSGAHSFSPRINSYTAVTGFGEKLSENELERKKRHEFKTDARNVRVTRSNHQENSKRLLEQEESQVEYDQVTQKQKEFIETSRLYVNQLPREPKIPVLDHERKNRLMQITSLANDDMQERLENYLDQRIDDEIQSDVTRRSAELQMSRSSKATQNSERSKQGVERAEYSREYNQRQERRYDKNDDRKSIRRNEQFENRNDARRLVVQPSIQFSDSRLLERNNAFTTEPKTTFYYRNYRFMKEGHIKQPSILLFNSYAALGQGLLFAYLIMKTCNGKNSLINHLESKVRGALSSVSS